MASTKPCLFERRWPGVIQTPIAIDAGTGIITMTSTKGLHPKQKVTLTQGADGLVVVVRRVMSSTSILVEPFDNKKVLGPGKFLSMLIAFDGGTLTAPEQERNKIGGDVALKNSYAEEPTVALRVNPVDYWGCQYDDDNPFPVMIPDASFTVTLDSAKNPFILNVPIPAQNTEYSFTLPIGTRKAEMISRNRGKLQYSFTVGATDSNYMSISPGVLREIEDIDLAVATVVYFECTKNNDILEVQYWT